MKYVAKYNFAHKGREYQAGDTLELDPEANKADLKDLANDIEPTKKNDKEVKDKDKDINKGKAEKNDKEVKDKDKDINKGKAEKNDKEVKDIQDKALKEEKTK